ncbi:MAG: aminotransferase class V-fold PLP-dependent enzyme [Candidatus Moraniibacteriota bacterium]
MFDPKIIRHDFPIYDSQPDLVYLDSAATALKPKAVIDAMNGYYFEYSANVARGLYPLAEGATNKLEAARRTVGCFVNAENKESVVFTANATHSINLVALGLEHTLTSKNNIVVTELEHHSNYLPWKELAHRTSVEFRTAHFDSDGMIDESHLVSLIDEQTAVVAFSAVSNVFGIINPIATLIRAIRKKNQKALILVDACQAAGHIPIDMQQWDADFAVFSGHKLFGPTGIGVLAGKKTSLELLVPMQVGGGTVLDACSPVTEYKRPPENLEGGTPNIAGAIGLAHAIEYVGSLGLENIHRHETMLTRYGIDQLRSAFDERIHILGTEDSQVRTGIISFALDGIHPHDLAHLLGEASICVRAGEHCASPLHRAAGIRATTRISFSVYNTPVDIDRFISILKKIYPLFAL